MAKVLPVPHGPLSFIAKLQKHFSEQSTPPSYSDQQQHHQKHHLEMGAHHRGKLMAPSASPLSDLLAQTVPGGGNEPREEEEEDDDEREDGHRGQKRALDLTMHRGEQFGQRQHQPVGLLKIKEPKGAGLNESKLFGPTQPMAAAAAPIASIEQLLLGPLGGRGTALYSANAFLNLLQQQREAAMAQAVGNWMGFGS